MHGFLISEKLSVFFSFLFFPPQFYCRIRFIAHMITCLCVEAEWLHCLFMPILGPEEKDKAVLRLDDSSISGHSGGLSSELLS